MAPFVKIPDKYKAAFAELGAKTPVLPLAVCDEKMHTRSLRDILKGAAVGMAKEGLGFPGAINRLYIYKSLAYCLTFLSVHRFASRSSSFGASLRDRVMRSDAFRRFIVFNLLFEVLHLGCGFGPLNSRVFPPNSAWFHWLCPGTLKLPLRGNPRDSSRPLLPFLSPWRSKADVLLFLGYLLSMFRALSQKRVSTTACRAICGFLAVLCVTDHTAFLASRGEVYGYMLACHAAGPRAARVGTQLCQLAIYVWAGISKLGPWFPHVIQVMLCNSPLCPGIVTKRLFKNIEAGDLRVSTEAKLLAHMGAAVELAVPALVPFGGLASKLGMFCSLNLHTFIFSNFPTGVPMEWNIFTPVAVWHLFLDDHDGLDWHALRELPSKHPVLTACLAAALVGVQTMGSLCPPTNSFLTSMKYYAGNWPASVWLVKVSAWEKLQRMKTFSDYVPQQLELLGQSQMVRTSQMRVYAFRAMHLPYRNLPALIEKALQGRPFTDYYYQDGEMIAGVVLGYSFGDGYLHSRYMLQQVQDTCGFEAGECIHISIDSCPALGYKVPWAIRDATALWEDDKAIGIGETDIRDLQQMQPY
eukprot:TRINITY_DN30180_c0_g1_i2.p1 TRINITY_DN30180_c0_g1~~TRINITY_DN30180_c0_g1_i2.p1  ORF type:complete len:583 (-),score=92.16 TRINITY_DN30180_c0_g1_i2:79-1827(-)